MSINPLPFLREVISDVDPFVPITDHRSPITDHRLPKQVLLKFSSDYPERGPSKFPNTTRRFRNVLPPGVQYD